MRESLYPVITNVLVNELHEKSQTPKPTALGTPLRYSSAFACGRQQGYAALGAEPTEPMDEAGAWVTGLGTIIHEALQDAISRIYPNAEFEVASGNDFVSGSCDALIPISDIEAVQGPTDFGGTHVLYELKTMGTYSFDKQVGWNRMRGSFTDKGPTGPAAKAVAQAGMNAIGIEQSNPLVKIQTIIMGSITFEALSKQKSANMGVDGVRRFLAEFEVPRSEWGLLAINEIKRMTGINESIKNGYLPERTALDDDGDVVSLNPRGSAWQCEYCAFRTTCEQDGQGEVYIMNSVVSNKGDE